MSTYLGAALKRRLYPTVFCYHGCVARRADVLTFRESIADIKAHVRTLQQAGYTFLLPSDYKAWQDGSVSYAEPVTCLHFDDGLASIDLIVPWLIEQGIPCGLALIARRHRTVDPEGDFLSWATIGKWVQTGLVEVICHTYNLHHLTLIQDDTGFVDVAPVLEGPCWVDDGDVVYRDSGDSRWYWDFSHVDDGALAVPIWGTDQYDGATPVTTSLFITPKITGTVALLRLWMALSRPYDTGSYDAAVTLKASNVGTRTYTPPASIPAGLEYWFDKLDDGSAKKIVFIGDSTTESAPAMYNELNVLCGGGLLPGVTFINRGQSGAWSSDWLAGTVTHPPSVCYADQAALYVVCFGIDDVRNGGTSQATLQANLAAIVDALRANVPTATVMLRVPNSFLSTDPTNVGFINPLSSAQAYTDIMRGAYLALDGAWPAGSPSVPGVIVWDAMDAIFGTTCQPSSPLMLDNIHPSFEGYTAIADGLFELIRFDSYSVSGATAPVTVWDGVVSPKQYATRSQWVAREFYTIELDTPFAVTAGVPIELEFATANAGGALAMIYAVPSTDPAFGAVSTCAGLVRAGSLPAPDKQWQYIDYPPGERYQVKPCVILGLGTGAVATDAQYEAYVAADFAAFNNAVAQWSTAVFSYYWLFQERYIYGSNTHKVGWEYANVVHAVVPLWRVVDSDYQALRFTVSATENFHGGDADEMLYSNDFSYSEKRAMVEEALTRSYTACFRLWIGDTEQGPWTHLGYTSIYEMQHKKIVGIAQFSLEANVTRYLLIETLNGGWSTGGQQRVRWQINAVEGYGRWAAGSPPAPTVDQVCYPFGSYLDAGAAALPQDPQVTDAAPLLKSVMQDNGYEAAYTIQGVRNVVQSEFREPDLRQTEWALGRWLVYGDQAPAVSLNNLAAISGMLFQDVPHRGVTWQVSTEPDPIGNATIKRRPQVLDYVACDAWFFDGAGGITQGVLNDGGTYLDYEPLAGVYTPGETITETGSGATATLTWVEAAFGVMRVSAVAGAWTGGATITGGTSGATGTGDAAGPVAYADDKAWLQARGVRRLLILSNYSALLDDIDPAIASHVVNNPGTYIPQVVAVAVDDGWDGITMNLEAVPAADRAAATSFYEQLARALHAEGKLLHATVPAATGTAYDADWWVGWCDHFALAKVCDAIKVMSYTESGPGTDPGPAAPQEFWDLVYARMRRVIAEPYWPRVLCGCRTFGHLWNISEATTEYITYHQGIAEALNYAKRIDTRDSEAGWGTDNIKAWFGTPETVDRAQREAAASFGGIGLWKLDDGDIEECFPDVRQIGRQEIMSHLNTRFPPTISYGSTGGPAFSTSVVETQSGDESRNARRALPLCEYDVSIGVRTQAQADAVRDLFMVAQGRRNTFRYKDWADFSMTAQVIGTADGIITTFQLVKDYTVGAYSLTRTITLPVDGTLTVYRNGSLVGGWTCNYGTGLVSFGAPPAAGVITATCEFDVRARFDIDYLPTEIVARNPASLLFSPGTVRLVERRA